MDALQILIKAVAAEKEAFIQKFILIDHAEDEGQKD